MITDRTPLPRRSRYLDTLRAIAIVRVFLHHSLWLGWLTVAFPSMPVMFGLAGYLTAVSLDRGGARRTVTSRLRRLLPPLWTLAAVALPLMFLHGWLTDAQKPLRVTELANWAFPLANPPSSTWGGPFAMALWYLRAYLWFVLLSPLLYWAFRRLPLAALVAPVVLAVLFHVAVLPLPVSPLLHDVLWSTATFGTCWMLGFARHSGLLDRISARRLAVIALAVAAGGAIWGLAGAGLPGDPMAEMLWGTAFVLVVLRLRPSLAWLDRLPRVSGAVALLNARAVTIYVWHLPALYLAGFVVGGTVPILLVGLVFTALAVAATGWVEDLAARRRPALLPAPVRGVAARAAAPCEPESSRAAVPASRKPESPRTAVPASRQAVPSGAVTP